MKYTGSFFYILAIGFLNANASLAAEYELPPGYTRCLKDSECMKAGKNFKCLPQKYACGPSSTCVAEICQKIPASKSKSEEAKCKQNPHGRWTEIPGGFACEIQSYER